MRDLLAVVFRRKWLILGIFGLTSLIVGVKQLGSETTFSADATLLLNRQGGARASVFERSGRVLPWTEVIESEVEVVRSGPVLQGAREMLRVPTEKHPEGIKLNARQIGRKVTSGIIGESNVLFVSGSDLNPDIAIAVTNAVAEAYVAYHKELYELPDASGQIQEKADSTLVELGRTETKRSVLLADLGVNEVAQMERARVQQRGTLRQQLSNTNRSITRIDVELEDASNFLAGETDALPFGENTGSVNGSALNQSYTNLVRRMGELSVLREKYTEEHPQVRVAVTEVEVLKDEVRSRTMMIVSAREHQRRALERERTEIESEINMISAELRRLPAVVREIDVLNAQIKVLSEQYAQLSEQAVTSEINRSTFADYSVKVLSPALYAEPSGRGDLVRIFLAPILALMIGIGVAFYLENLDHSISNREDVERHVNIPVLASFPETRVGESESGVRRTLSGASIPFRRRGSGRM